MSLYCLILVFFKENVDIENNTEENGSDLESFNRQGHPL